LHLGRHLKGRQSNKLHLDTDPLQLENQRKKERGKETRVQVAANPALGKKCALLRWSVKFCSAAGKMSWDEMITTMITASDVVVKTSQSVLHVDSALFID